MCFEPRTEPRWSWESHDCLRYHLDALAGIVDGRHHLVAACETEYGARTGPYWKYSRRPGNVISTVTKGLPTNLCRNLLKMGVVFDV